MAETKGIVDRIYVEKASETGDVWVRFRGDGDDPIQSAKALLTLLNDKCFDDNRITAKFVPDSLFYAKVK
jgi:hypothetical protein